MLTQVSVDGMVELLGLHGAPQQTAQFQSLAPGRSVTLTLAAGSDPKPSVRVSVGNREIVHETIAWPGRLP
jgi:hypothetical protein